MLDMFEFVGLLKDSRTVLAEAGSGFKLGILNGRGAPSDPLTLDGEASVIEFIMKTVHFNPFHF